MLHHFLRATRANSQDPYFKQVALLLHGDGTNGAQNNTFLDSSTNNFSITRNGNTTQGTFSPFSLPDGQWSNFSTGTSGFLSATQNGLLDVGTGDFTIEGWIYLTVDSSVYNFLFNYSYSGGGLYIRFPDSGFGNKLQVSMDNDVTKWSCPVTRSQVVNRWVHIAFTRQSNSCRLWVDGVLQNINSGTNPSTYPFTSFTSNQSIGNPTSCTIAGVSGQPFNGYASNVRVVKGTAVYTANFTPSTTPLTAISGTSLLTCQSNRFIDNSSNNFTITRNGDVRATAFSPFAPTSAYSPSVNGGSGYFDGTGDTITLASSSSLSPESGNFCLEYWVYFNALTQGNQYIVGSSSQTGGLSIGLNSSNQFAVGNAFVSFLITDTVAAVAGQWYHVAVCRTGTNFSLFVNGSRRGTVTSSYNFTVANLTIGSNSQTVFLNGYISNMRFVKGSSPYDPTASTLTVPTAPLTDITNTSLLLNFTNAGIFDNAGKNVGETVGNVQISTSVKKYGTGSMSFDGSGDYLTMPARPETLFGTSPFTVEFWLYPNSSTTNIMSKGTVASSTNWQCDLSGGNFRFFYNNLTTLTGSTVLPANTWHHLVIVGNRTNIVLYVNGVQDGSVTYTYNYSQDSVLRVGVNRATGNYCNGYIDDLRITNGIARYTANFTPPQGPYPNQ